MGWGREERLLKSLRAARLPLALLVFIKKLSSLHSFSPSPALLCPSATCVPLLPLLLPSHSYWRYMDTVELGLPLFPALSPSEHRDRWQWWVWKITESHSSRRNHTLPIYNLIQISSLSDTQNLLWCTRTHIGNKVIDFSNTYNTVALVNAIKTTSVSHLSHLCLFFFSPHSSFSPSVLPPLSRSLLSKRTTLGNTLSF